jgi:hypothetical protein
VADRVRLAGWIDDDELDRLYRTALMTVCPSHYEGYGLPVAESLARGVPTVASRIPSHVEIAAGAARWFEPGDEAALAAEIAAVAGDAELRRDMGERALARSRALQDDAPTWGPALAGALRACAPSAGSSPSASRAAGLGRAAGSDGPAPAPSS